MPDRLLLELADWLAAATRQPWGHRLTLDAAELASLQELAVRLRTQADGIPQPFGQADERLLRDFAARLRDLRDLWSRVSVATPEERAAARRAEEYSRAVEALAERLALGEF